MEDEVEEFVPEWESLTLDSKTVWRNTKTNQLSSVPPLTSTSSLIEKKLYLENILNNDKEIEVLLSQLLILAFALLFVAIFKICQNIFHTRKCGFLKSCKIF
jgi:hypothetical protein